jgi:hypothetical protein
MTFNKDNKGEKYRAVVIIPAAAGKVAKAMKFENWINDYSLHRKQFQRFIKNRHPEATYANLYNKDTGFFSHRITF